MLDLVLSLDNKNEVPDTDKMTLREDYKDVLAYIDQYWDQVTFKPTEKIVNQHVITIPHPFIAPTKGEIKGGQSSSVGPYCSCIICS